MKKTSMAVNSVHMYISPSQCLPAFTNDPVSQSSNSFMMQTVRLYLSLVHVPDEALMSGKLKADEMPPACLSRGLCFPLPIQSV